MTADSLRALLANVVDYAGLYPPASLRLEEVIANYESYLASPEAWMLNRLVLPIEKLRDVRLGEKWRVTLLVDGEPGTLPPQVETLETKGVRRLSLPTYCEAPLESVADGYAKVRTATPSAETLADFLCSAAARRLPFKATAGLHHPIRTSMHGFLNVFAGAVFAWQGMGRIMLTNLLNEGDSQAFDFQNDCLRWRDSRASTAEVAQARREFAHSFGSCSFQEPSKRSARAGTAEMIDRTHEPELKSWVESANVPGAEFPIQNLPYATFRRIEGEQVCLGVAIGNQVLDVTEAFGIGSVQAVMTLQREGRVELRQRISDFLATRTPGSGKLLIPMSGVELLLPCPIGDYTDFYASIDHATNVGRMFRPDNPLLPNYKWIPIAYHGRSSSIVVSGTAVRRPCGQIAETPAGPPVYAPSRALDYEVEAGAFLGPGNAMGDPIPITEAEEHLFGVCLLNDWSARDVQTWEYQPLGPFLAKNFATSISPWVVTCEALEPFRRPAPQRPAEDPQPLQYLRTADGAYGITLEVWLRSARMREPFLVSRSDFSTLYWTLGQLIAHHTSNGCPIRAGDLIGSGTVSGPDKGNRGCLLEITSRGREPLELPTGETRRFLEDGDEVVLRGWCERPGFRRIGFGECRGMILPALRPKSETASHTR